MTGELLSRAVLAGVKAVAGAEQQTKLLEGETLPSEVREEVAAFVVLTELAAGGHVRHLGEGGEEVLRPDDAGLALHPAGVRGELGLDQGGDDQGQRQYQ